MVSEKLLLAAIIKDRKAHETIRSIGTELSFGPIGNSIYRTVEKYYDTDPDVNCVAREFLESWIDTEFKDNGKPASAHRQYLAELPSDVSARSITELARQVRQHVVGTELSLALANGSDEEVTQKLIQEYQAIRNGETATRNVRSELIDVLDTADLLEENSDVEYIKLWPKPLNDRLDGGCLRGHHILCFARPETGKTLFSINLVAGFIAQGLQVLYVGNEEPAADIRDRIRGRLLKTSRQSIRSNRAGFASRLASGLAGGARILGSSSFTEMRACLASSAEVNPRKMDVVVIDQVRNMRLRSEGRTAELEAAGIEARAIAKEFNVLVISITQHLTRLQGKSI